MISLELTKNEIALIDNADSDLINFKWHVVIIRDYKYASRVVSNPNIKPRQIRMYLHQIILERVLNRKLEANEKVDHVNGNTLDNTRKNLRLASHTENMRNRKLSKNNTSGYKGVDFHQNKWRAEIQVNNKTIYLGHFNTKEDAHKAYCEAADQYFGEFARYK